MIVPAIRALIDELAANCPGCNYYKHPGRRIVPIEDPVPGRYRSMTAEIACPWCELRKAAELELKELEAY